MRLEAPPERMTAASISLFISPRSLGVSARRSEARFDPYFFVRGGFRIAAHGNQLGDDTDSNFLRRERADLKAHGGVDALELFGAVALFFESFVDGQHFASAADHADVARLRAHGPCQYAHVFLVSASDDDEVGGGVGLDFLEGLRVTGEDVLRHGEALKISEGFAVVDHADGETRGVCGFGHGHGDMAGAEDVDNGLRKNGLDEDFHRAAADSADQRAVFADEHTRAFVAGDGAVGVHDGGQRAALPSAPHLHDFFKQVHVAFRNLRYAAEARVSTRRLRRRAARSGQPKRLSQGCQVRTSAYGGSGDGTRSRSGPGMSKIICGGLSLSSLFLMETVRR